MADVITMFAVNIGEIPVKEIKCQGCGDKVYCNNGAIYHSDGTVTFEYIVLFDHKPTPEEIEKHKQSIVAKASMREA